MCSSAPDAAVAEEEEVAISRFSSEEEMLVNDGVDKDIAPG
jgi:hypothetical protein